MSRVRPEKFVHVVYRTRRFDAMLRWYATVFDARVQHQDPVLAFLTYDDEHHRFAFINMAALDPAGDQIDRTGVIGVDHVAYTYATLRDLCENYAQLKELGITPYWCIHHGVTVSMYYADPDGNQMEFQVDSYASNDEANAFMGGQDFAENPIGVEYDPDELLARLRGGEDASTFLLRKIHQPVSPVRGTASRS
ncbi:Biphenyl-2,3-diol 1,2-dioxygenase 2 [Variovorax sp. SRS16]|uniref:VOC family protein n=1 Tax=Variovorax sp. SRS16 TaxID=282217 RepID=UPI0013179D73|nr:VOC family protein [Variovorax sp. SRS16]VTU23239.1 Biphenyl-2,3-diol 1,2-dioxygenase 2 [Variovorax sp. SRS16]